MTSRKIPAFTALPAWRCSTGTGQYRRRHLDGWHAGKMPGRIGDSPIIGAGNLCVEPVVCGVRARAPGEYFIRLGVAREVCNLVYFKKMKLQDAVDEVIHKELEALHGDGGSDCDYSGWTTGVELQYAGDVSRAACRRRAGADGDLSRRALMGGDILSAPSLDAGDDVTFKPLSVPALLDKLEAFYW